MSLFDFIITKHSNSFVTFQSYNYSQLLFLSNSTNYLPKKKKLINYLIYDFFFFSIKGVEE